MSPKLFNSLLLMASLVLYYLVIGPLYSGDDTGIWKPERSINSLIASNSQYDGTVSKVDAIIRNSTVLKSNYDELVASTTKVSMETMVPSKIDEVRLLSEVTSLANTLGLATKDITVKDKAGPFPRYVITITLKATYQQFKDFIKLFETSLRVYSLESITLKMGETEGNFKFDIQLSTHYLK